MRPIISIIVPVYNSGDYLDECVNSVLVQSYENFELLLIDDGSNDGCSPQKCDEWRKRDSRIRVIHKENGGPSSVRNLGLKETDTQYVYFMDSDDYISKDMLKTTLDIIKRTGADIVEFNCMRFTDAGVFLGTTERIDDGLITKEDALHKLVIGEINSYVPNKLFKRSVFQGIRFPEGFLWEDLGTVYKLFMNADKIYCLSEPMYFYRKNPKSIVGTMSAKALGDIFLMRYQRYKELLERYPSIAKHELITLALSARRLYDRSLWERVNVVALEQALIFLKENKEAVLMQNSSFAYKVFYTFPSMYKWIRHSRHFVGNIVKKFK